MIDLKELNKLLDKATDLEARLRECTDRKEGLDLMWEELAARNDCNNLFRDNRKELLRLAEIGKLYDGDPSPKESGRGLSERLWGK